MEANVPIWATILIAVVPTAGSIAVAVIANRRSRKAENAAVELQKKSASREDFVTITENYRKLVEDTRKENTELKDRVRSLEKEVKALEQTVAKLAGYEIENTELKGIIKNLRQEVKELKRIIKERNTRLDDEKQNN